MLDDIFKDQAIDSCRIISHRQRLSTYLPTWHLINRWHCLGGDMLSDAMHSTQIHGFSRCHSAGCQAAGGALHAHQVLLKSCPSKRWWLPMHLYLHTGHTSWTSQETRRERQGKAFQPRDVQRCGCESWPVSRQRTFYSWIKATRESSSDDLYFLWQE